MRSGQLHFLPFSCPAVPRVKQDFADTCHCLWQKHPRRTSSCVPEAALGSGRTGGSWARSRAGSQLCHSAVGTTPLCEGRTTCQGSSGGWPHPCVQRTLCPHPPPARPRLRHQPLSLSPALLLHPLSGRPGVGPEHCWASTLLSQSPDSRSLSHSRDCSASLRCGRKGTRKPWGPSLRSTTLCPSHCPWHRVTLVGPLCVGLRGKGSPPSRGPLPWRIGARAPAR